MSPLSVLLEALSTAKRASTDWHTAWRLACDEALASTCDPGDWVPVLKATEPQWQQAYTRSGYEHDRLAKAVTARVSILAEGRELVDQPGQDCRHCDQPIPALPGKGRRALYCGEACRRAASAARVRVRG